MPSHRYGVGVEPGTGIALGLGSGPVCGSVMTGLVGVYGGGVTGAYVGAGGGDTRLTGTGMYGGGDMCTKSSVRDLVFMLGCISFGSARIGRGAGLSSGPGVIGFSAGILLYGG